MHMYGKNTAYAEWTLLFYLSNIAFEVQIRL